MSHVISLDKCIEKADHTGILVLTGRNLRQFPMSAQDLSDLQDTLEADISKNRFDKIPREICMFSGLEKLRCYHNSIRIVPEYITYMSNLRHLDLSRNYIPSLPPEMCRLNLVSLDLSCNRLVALPVDIGQMVTLQKLDLGCNSLPDLPPGFTNLKKLRYLNLHQNELKELPSDIDKMPLVHLDVSTNLIRRLPTSLRNILSLVVLEVTDNPLEAPPSHVCVRGRVHIFKYLRCLEEQGADSQSLHTVPMDVKRRRGDKRRSRPPSGYSTVSVESASSFADEMHRIVDSAFGSIVSSSQPDLHHEVTANSHHQPSSKGSLKGQSSPGRRRGPATSQSATLPRTANARTIEEEPEVIAKQHSAPSKTEDNRKASSGGGGRSLPGEVIRRSGSWNAYQQRVVEGQEEEMDRSSVPVHSGDMSKTPESDRRAAVAPVMRSAKSTSDMISEQQTPVHPRHLTGVDHTPSDEGPEPERFSTPETPKTGNPKAGLVLAMKAGQEAGSGDEQLTPTADEQPMVLWESKDLPGLDANGLGNLTDKEGKAADSTVELEQVTISLKPEEPKRSPSPVTQKVMDDDTLTRRKGKTEGEAAIDPKKEDGEGDVEAVKEADGVAAKQGTVRSEQTVTPQAPSAIMELTSEPKPAHAARRVSPASSKSSSVDAKKPPPRPSGGVAGGRPTRPKSMADAKEMSPVRPAVPAKPTISGTRASQLKMSSVSPESSKESSPVRQTGQPKEMSPNRSGSVAAKKDAMAGRGVTAKPKSTAAPGKSPARQPVATPSPRGRAAAKTGNAARSDDSPSRVSAAKPKSGGSPSRGQVSKPKTSTSPSRSPNMKRKTDLPSGKAAASRLSQGGGLTVERPLTRARSDETNNSSQSEKESTDGGAEAKLDSSAAKTDKGEGEVAKKKSDAAPKGSGEGQKKRRRRISSASTGSEEGRRSRPSSRSSVDDGEELKEAMKRRSLPRQQVDFTVKRQEMNMMHGYKKMLVVKQSLEKLLGVTVGEDFLGSLEDGIVLCQLMNKLHPGTIAHFHMPTDDQPLSVPKKVRNVEAFIRGCKQIEIEHICTASDIMDAKDPMKILKCVDDLLSSV